MTSRTELEQHLLADPFDAAARARYAQLLLDADEAEAQRSRNMSCCASSNRTALPPISARPLPS